MRHKKGFTLVELLGVFTLLGVILLLIVPNVTQMLKRAKEDDYKRFLNDLYLATEAYIESDNRLSNSMAFIGGKAFLRIEDLIYAGYLRSTIVNPKTNQKIDPSGTMVAFRTATDKVVYSYREDDMTEDAYVTNGRVLHFDNYQKPVDGKWQNYGTANIQGTMQSFTGTTQLFGSEMNFDGTNYVSLGEQNYEKITISAHVLIPEETSGEQTIIDNFETGGYGLTYDPGNNNKLTFQIYVNGSYYTVHSKNSYQLNTWYYMVGTYDGTTMKLYVDGELQGTLALSGVISPPKSNTELMIATNPVGSSAGTKYKFSLRSVNLYNRALTETEVKQNYNVEKQRYDYREKEYNQNGIIAQYDGYTIPHSNRWRDLSGNGNHGTMIGFDNTSGYMGGKIKFDGINDVINLGMINYDFGNQFTLSIVLKMTAEKKLQEFFGNWESAGIGLSNSTAGNFGITGYLVNSYQSVVTTTGIDSNTYHTIVGTYDGTTMKLYIDGKLDKQANYTGAVKPSTAPMTIGANPSASATYANYTNCEVLAASIYQRALTEAEVKANYNIDQSRFGF